MTRERASSGMTYGNGYVLFVSMPVSSLRNKMQNRCSTFMVICFRCYWSFGMSGMAGASGVTTSRITRKGLSTAAVPRFPVSILEF
ncbi:hypothetical protein BDV26DRAFT_78812 [Aspergillus bertholletiae]|uniref:Uncharacterized protein n=1 Tax=Aspergillus bertholletiae TaxID=1226010 RepID=A0A5N7BIE0_9EURO|nr:hypothetical protein BDV26DRAFT_78812 [Aspergillus bertholletiae]